MCSTALLARFGETSWFVRISLNVLSQLTCFLQIIMLLRGIHEMVSEKALNRRRFRQLLGVFLVIAVASVVAYNEQPSDEIQRNLLRLGSRTITGGLGFLITGIVVMFHPKFTKGFGQRLLALSCFTYSFYQLYFFLVVLLGVIHVQIGLPRFYGVADILVVGVMGMSMVMWLLEDERQKLEEDHKELDRFLYSTSHDLKAPIASIMGLTYLGKLEFQEEKARMFMGLIEERAKKLDNVISDILSVSRTKKFELKMERLQLGDLINEVVTELKFNHGATSISLDYARDESHVLITDYSQMKLILRNLIGNAVKYHNLDQPNPYIRIAFRRYDDYVEISIADNGQGIRTENLPKIFEMFYRASDTTEGTGLGLYIVSEALNRVKGSISVESVYGSGTTFTIQMEDA
jgi:signal transduction histidine kinase